MRVVFCVLACVFCFISSSTSLVIPVNDHNWYWTEQNWLLNLSPSYAQTANPGSYFKIVFTGSQKAILNLDQSGVPSSAYMTVGWSVDDGPEMSTTLPVSGNNLLLADKLSSSTPHTIFFYVRNSLQSLDRWYEPLARLRITGLQVDDNTTTLPPTLHPKRMMVYWDSIGEGVNVVPGSGDLAANNARITWAFVVAEGISAEISVVAWGRQGYAITGNGNVPPLWSTSGSANTSAWNWIDSKHPRTFTKCPDVILCGHGTNDFLNNINPDTVTANTLGWLTSQRQTCPNVWIFLVVPFGGFAEASLEKAYKMFQDEKKDIRSALVNLGADAKKGLDHWGPSFEASDGIHPLAWRDGQLGAMLTSFIVPHLAGSVRRF